MLLQQGNVQDVLCEAPARAGRSGPGGRGPCTVAESTAAQHVLAPPPAPRLPPALLAPPPIRWDSSAHPEVLL